MHDPPQCVVTQPSWRHAQVLLLGALLIPSSRTVTGALRVMGLALEGHFTRDYRGLNRTTWSAHQGSRILLGLLITRLVPPGATIVFGADNTVERRSWPQDHGQWLLRGRDTLHQEAGHLLLWLEVGVHDALDAGALEPAGVGVPFFDRPLLARDEARQTTA